MALLWMGGSLPALNGLDMTGDREAVSAPTRRAIRGQASAQRVAQERYVREQSQRQI